MAAPSTATLLLKVQVVGGPQKLTAALHQLGSAQVTRGLNAQTAALTRLNSIAGKTGGLFGRGNGLLGAMANFSLVASGVTRGVRAIGGAMSSALAPLMEFQKNLAQIQSKGGFDAGQMKELAESFMQVGRSTMFSPQAAAEGGIALAASGLRPNQIKQQLPHVLNFAQAHGLSTEESSDMLVNVSKQLGQPTEEFQRLSDMMTKAANMSTINVRELAHTMSYVGPLAREAGTKPDQLFAMIAGLGNMGIKGSKAGTGVRNLLIALSKKPRRGKTSQNILKSFGMTQKDLQAGFGGEYDDNEQLGTKGLYGIHALMAHMKNQMDKHKLSNVKRVEALAVLFGAYGMTTAAGGARFAADNGENGLMAFAQALQDVNGETQKAADLMGETLPGKIAKMDASWDTFKITMTGKVAPAISKVLDRTRELILEMEKFSQPETKSAWKDLAAEMGKTVQLMASTDGGESVEPPWVRQWRTVKPLVEATRDAALSYFQLVNTGKNGYRPVSEADEAYAERTAMEAAIGKEPQLLGGMFGKAEDIQAHNAWAKRRDVYLSQKKAREEFEKNKGDLFPEPEWKPGDLSPTGDTGWKPGDPAAEGATKGMVEVLIGFDPNNMPKVSVKNMKASSAFDLSVGQTSSL